MSKPPNEQNPTANSGIFAARNVVVAVVVIQNGHEIVTHRFPTLEVGMVKEAVGRLACRRGFEVLEALLEEHQSQSVLGQARHEREGRQ